MTDALSPSIIKDYVLPTVISLSEDPIPNIRFNVAKALETLTPSLKQDANTVDLIESTVVPSLQKLTNDKDVDVRFFASRALLDGELHDLPSGSFSSAVLC
jgi:serine/threonine-protein phosphatase 2A regulatory subunit A